MDVDVLVVGAGAAGLMAATTAARAGARTVLLEKNQRPGLKILISGGGRCNLTTTRTGADLEQQYGPVRGRWLRHALRSYPPRSLCAEVESAGVRLQEEDLEKIFPVSRRASDVLDAWLRMADHAGVQLVREAPVKQVGELLAGFEVHSGAGTWRCRSLVLATGGLSYPRTGTTGDGYAFSRQFGHSIVPTVPALAPLQVDEPWVHELAGLVVDAQLSLFDPAGRLLLRRRRPTLFTHKGLSGPGAMDLAGDVEEQGCGAILEIDFLPDQTAEELNASWLEQAKQHGKRSVPHALPVLLPERLRQRLAKSLGLTETTLAELTKSQRKDLLAAVKHCRVPVPRSLGFGQAEVTRGGVTLGEVDAATCMSKLRPGLFLCGEILDIDGPIGGFNFQAAFATGRLAGAAAAAWARK